MNLPFEITLEDERIKEVAPLIKKIEETPERINPELKRIRGYHITFKNNYVISIQFGWGNYCDNYNLDCYSKYPDYRTSTTAEIAYWKVDNNGKCGEMISFGNDTVKGYLTFDEVLEWMKIISVLPFVSDVNVT